MAHLANRLCRIHCKSSKWWNLSEWENDSPTLRPSHWTMKMLCKPINSVKKRILQRNGPNANKRDWSKSTANLPWSPWVRFTHQFQKNGRLVRLVTSRCFSMHSLSSAQGTPQYWCLHQLSLATSPWHGWRLGVCWAGSEKCWDPGRSGSRGTFRRTDAESVRAIGRVPKGCPVLPPHLKMFGAAFVPNLGSRRFQDIKILWNTWRKGCERYPYPAQRFEMVLNKHLTPWLALKPLPTSRVNSYVLSFSLVLAISTKTNQCNCRPTGWSPPVISWFINPIN